MIEHLGKYRHCFACVSEFPSLDNGTIEACEGAEAELARARHAEGLRRHHVARPAFRVEGPVAAKLYLLGFDHKRGLRSGEAHLAAIDPY